jgi:SAM-dependent methyltransferase
MTAHSDQNQPAYEHPRIVQQYTLSHLQNAEALALIHLADDFKGKTVLDIGCGAGRTSFFLIQLTDHYTGLDYSQSMVAACQRRFPGKRFEHGDVRDLSRFTDGSFASIVFSFNGIDSIDHTDRLKALAEIRRVLRPGGLFLFSSHNRNCSDKNDEPVLQTCLNPWRLYANYATWQRQRKNRRSRKLLEIHTDEYEIINDPAIDYSMLHYYISAESQIQQMSNNGFTVTHAWDSEGNALCLKKPVAKTTWIYYACRRG